MNRISRLFLHRYIAIAFGLLLPLAMATTVALVAAEPAAGEAKPGLSLLGMVISAGPPEYLLIAFSVMGFAFAIQGFLTIKREAIVPTGVYDDLHNILGAETEDGQPAIGVSDEAYEEARRILESDTSSAGRILAAALEYRHVGFDAMKDAADEAYVTESTRWALKPGYLSLFANLATLLGLFGTVWGIIESFMEMAKNAGGVDISKLSSTIGVSLITTANGMAIAVPMLAFAFMQRSKLAGYFQEINEGTLQILAYFRPPVQH